MSEGDRGPGSPATPEPGAAAGMMDAACEDPEPPSGPARPAHDRHADALELAVLAEAGDWSPFPACEAAVRAAAAALSRHPAAHGLVGREATVVLGDDALVRSLNATYRAKDAPTNVLSFPFQAPPGAVGDQAARCLGDVILACETLQREAAELAVPPNSHLQHLVIHGLLHLLGFDHQEQAEAERMEAIETAVLAGLGVADPYAPSGAE